MTWHRVTVAMCACYVRMQDMQTADTIKQRLKILFQQQPHITIEDLLALIESPDELRSNSFHWAVHKLIWRLNSRLQAYDDLKDFLHHTGRFSDRFVSAPAPHRLGIHGAQLCRSRRCRLLVNRLPTRGWCAGTRQSRPSKQPGRTLDCAGAVCSNSTLMV